MNLFRSEEHVRNFSGFKAESEGGIVPLQDMANVFSGSLFKRRMDQDYVTHMREYLMELVGAFQALGDFWKPPGA